MNNKGQTTASPVRSRCNGTSNDQATEHSNRHWQPSSVEPRCYWPTTELLHYRRRAFKQAAHMLLVAASLIREVGCLEYMQHMTREAYEWCDCRDTALKGQFPSHHPELLKEIEKFRELVEQHLSMLPASAAPRKT